MTPANQIQTGLTTLVQAWDRRLRLQQTVAWMSRALIVGLSVSVVAGLLSRWRPLLDRTELLLFSGLALVFAVGVLIAYVWGRERGTVESARRFDLAFGLQERVSTALELIEGRIRADETLTLLQTEDAYTHARTINADERLRFEVNRNEWLAVAGLVAMLAMLVIVPNTVAENLPIDPERVEIIAAGEDAVEDAIETVATDTSLDQETRDTLLEALEANLAILQDEAISADEALAIMGDVERLLQAESDRLREQSESDQQALSSAAEALNGSPQEQPGEAQEGTEGETLDPMTLDPMTLDPMTLEEAIKQTKDALENAENQSANDEDQQATQAVMSENMQSAGQQVQALSPELAQALQDAAQALQQGDTQAAQEALERAEELAQQQQSQAEQTEQSAQSLDESAQDMQQAQQQGAPQSAQNSGQQQQQQPGQQPGQEGAQGESAEGAEGQQPSEQGQGQAENGQGETQPGNPQGQPSGEADPSSDLAELGTGQESGDLAADTRGQVNSEALIPSQSEPGAEREYEQIFDPSRVNGAGTGTVELEGDPEGAPIREGDFSDNPTGNALVPYNEVFSDYANAANEALNSSYIPLGLRDVVRDYFSSLSPSRTSTESE